MLTQANVRKMFIGFFVLILSALSNLSYADWGPRHDNHVYYRWHDHPHYGWHVHYLPAGHFTLWVGSSRYYYYDGLYYNYAGGVYVLVNPPMGAYVSVIPPDFQPVIISGMTYYTNNGVYYVLTNHGYKVVAQPVVTMPVWTVNVPSYNGGYAPVIIRQSGNGFVGPQGEFYPQFPKVYQLRAMYGR